MSSVTRTLRLKVKPEGHAWLNEATGEVNAVWHFLQGRGRWTMSTACCSWDFKEAT
jgi:hypothetical protein